jgi:multidrug resistance protein, MATE family
MNIKTKRKYILDEGGFKEVAYTATPLILSSFSASMMFFFDRLILAHHSLPAMNAVAAAESITTIFIYGVMNIAAISEVFVGQFNGAKKFDQVGPAVWQMLWFSLFTTPFFFLLATFSGKFLLSSVDFESHGQPYFQWLLYFGPFFAFNTALMGFFIGLGKVRLVTVLTFFGNGINIALNYFLAFGVSGYIPAMGAKGAAISTGISQVFVAFILFIVFLRRKNCEAYNTYQCTFNSCLFRRSIKVGAPVGLSYLIEMIAWAGIYQLCILTSAMHMTLMAFGQSLYTMMSFCLEGMNKAITSICGNLIGANKWFFVPKAFNSSVKLLLLLFCVSTFFLIVYPDFMIGVFLKSMKNTEEYTFVYNQLKFVSFYVWLYFLFEGINSICLGILTAAEDTLFSMVVNAFSSWIVAYIPIYYIIYKWHYDPHYCWAVFVVYAFFNAACFYCRYKFLLDKKTKHPVKAQT